MKPPPAQLAARILRERIREAKLHRLNHWRQVAECARKREGIDIAAQCLADANEQDGEVFAYEEALRIVLGRPGK